MYPVARSAFLGSGGPARLAVRSKISPVLGRVQESVWLPRARWQSGLSREFPKVDKETLDKLPKAISSGPAPPPRYVRIGKVIALTLLAFGLGFTMAASPAIPTVKAFLQPPTDEETLTSEHFTPPTEEVAEIERQIFSHPLTRKLLQDERWIASRPHLKIPAALRAQSLTGGTLLGPDKIAVPPLQFATADGSEFISLQYLGTALCGHPGIVHGGLLATLLDEGLARCCFPALPNRVAVTASLKIDYKKPAMAGQIVVLKAETTRVEGRKAWVTGRLMTLSDEDHGEGVVLTEGEALFIEPRGAATMKLVRG